MTKSTIVLFLLFVRLSAGTYPQPELLQKPQRPNTAEWIRSKFFQSKHSDQFPSVQERFQRMGDNDRSFSHRTIAKQSPRSRKALSMEIDSMLVYSQKDTIIQIAQIGEHGLSDITKIFKRGMYIDSLRHTFWRETDDEKNVIVQKDLLELWNGENWVPNYRYMERLTYDSGCVNSEARFEHFVNGTWSIEWTYTSSFLQLFDQYGNVISSIVCGYNPSTDGYIQFDTLYCRRSYSPDSVSCDIYADSTLTFMIPNIDHSISKKNELLDIVAHGNRQLVSRSVVSQTSSGWKEQRADLVDGDWKFIHSFSWIDTLENALVIYESYIQGDTLVSVRTLYEDTPNVRKRTNAKWINTSWVNQTRETAFYILNDMWVVDTLVFIEQWREENWKRRRLKRIILDDLYREQEASWYGWIDSVWVPEDGDMFIYSLDKSFAWSYYANSVIVHRSIDNSTGVTEHQLQVPKGFELHQNYPNPFNPSTTMGFTLQVSGLTSLKIYDALGREISTLVNEYLEAGVYHERTFDASHLASGIYFARLTSGGASQMKKMVLMK